MWCVVKTGLLVYSNLGSRTGVPQGTLCLQDCVVERIQNCISFKSPSREYIFRPETAEVLNRWMLALRQLCDKNGKVRHHSFHRTSFRVPSECSSCVKIIWGLGKPGFVCYACKYQIHLKCVANPNTLGNCPGYNEITSRPTLEEMLLSPSERRSLSGTDLQLTPRGSVSKKSFSEDFSPRHNMTPAELKEDINEKERLMKKRIAGVLTRYSSERREVLEELMLREIECVEDKYRQEKKELLAELTARRAA